jgi:hypothetical protein
MDKWQENTAVPLTLGVGEELSGLPCLLLPFISWVLLFIFIHVYNVLWPYSLPPLLSLVLSLLCCLSTSSSKIVSLLLSCLFF